MTDTFGGWTVTDFIRRIRSLEAELATAIEQNGRVIMHAERVDKEMESLLSDERSEYGNLFCWNCSLRQVRIEREMSVWHARAEKAEARVAELERMEEYWHNRALILEKQLEVSEQNHFHHHVEPAPAIEGHEREED